MNTNYGGIESTRGEKSGAALVHSYMTKVYFWMVAALGLTGFTAFYIAANQRRMEAVFSTIPPIALFAAQIILVLVLSAFIDKMSSAVATALFVFYSILMGVTMSAIFIVYSSESIATAFFISSSMFLALSAFGTLTKIDLSGLASFLFMALVGLIVASVVNLFVVSSSLEKVVNYAGVLIFAGLTATDTQKLRRLGAEIEDEETVLKYSITGALILYLDFINLLLFLLRVFGRRR
jgi:FtsH-binding integral membrane protein